jgi:hypothetical protein
MVPKNPNEKIGITAASPPHVKHYTVGGGTMNAMVHGALDHLVAEHERTPEASAAAAMGLDMATGYVLKDIVLLESGDWKMSFQKEVQ